MIKVSVGRLVISLLTLFLYHQVLVNEISRVCAVGHDTADFGRDQEYIFWFVFGKPVRNGFCVQEVQRLSRRGQQICVTLFC